VIKLLRRVVESFFRRDRKCYPTIAMDNRAVGRRPKLTTAFRILRTPDSCTDPRYIPALPTRQSSSQAAVVASEPRLRQALQVKKPRSPSLTSRRGRAARRAAKWRARRGGGHCSSPAYPQHQDAAAIIWLEGSKTSALTHSLGASRPRAQKVAEPGFVADRKNYLTAGIERQTNAKCLLPRGALSSL
jgi:hypothetical protein